ncbi:MAG: acetyl-CoA carboxylase, biotin carboxyl carrier protein, partial [Rhodobiaceae bacterium]|nr:acetyl-CoA carboxylase, biotin carboxyl carrier protein [Rhodobiaceae bacterium]
PATPAPAAAEAPAASDLAGALKSPMVGTAYLSPEPGAANFVKVGDTVSQGQTLLIVEAMKTMNPIAATKAGKITQIIVGNEQPVEFDEVLMIIE